VMYRGKLVAALIRCAVCGTPRYCSTRCRKADTPHWVVYGHAGLEEKAESADVLTRGLSEDWALSPLEPLHALLPPRLPRLHPQLGLVYISECDALFTCTFPPTGGCPKGKGNSPAILGPSRVRRWGWIPLGYTTDARRPVRWRLLPLPHLRPLLGAHPWAPPSLRTWSRHPARTQVYPSSPSSHPPRCWFRTGIRPPLGLTPGWLHRWFRRVRSRWTFAPWAGAAGCRTVLWTSLALSWPPTWLRECG
jgi:hypothetical protein